MIAGHVAGNLVEPWSERTVRAVARHAIERSQKRFLHRVVDIGPFGQKRCSDRVDRAEKATDELLERIPISPLDALRQRFIGRFAGAEPGLMHADSAFRGVVVLATLVRCVVHVVVAGTALLVRCVVHVAVVALFGTASAMIRPLERHELVNGLDGIAILRDDSQLAAARQLAIHVRDHIALRGHYRGSGHVLHVDECGRCELALAERARDLLEMPPDLRDAVGIVDITLQLDTAAVDKRVEEVRRCVLVHAHRLLTAFLQLRERGIRVDHCVGGLAVAVASRNPGERHAEERDENRVAISIHAAS
jgi:hypothetical protein